MVCSIFIEKRRRQIIERLNQIHFCLKFIKKQKFIVREKKKKFRINEFLREKGDNQLNEISFIGCSI